MTQNSLPPFRFRSGRYATGNAGIGARGTALGAYGVRHNDHARFADALASSFAASA